MPRQGPADFHSVRLFLLGIFFAAMAPWRWIRHGPPACRKYLLGVLFFVLFLTSDGSSAASQAWEGAPPTYLPVGLPVALLLAGGVHYAPLIFVSGLAAALLNYHRALFGWCGIPGVSGLYICYVAAAVLLRGRLRIDMRLQGLRDVARYVLVLLTAETISACIGMLTL